MAELNIQRKERAVWPWVAGGIILVLLILLLSGAFSDNDSEYNDRRDADTTAVAPPPDVPRHL